MLSPLTAIITRAARRRINRSIAFLDGNKPQLPPGIGNCLLYIHVPFCERLCPYCSFHRQVYREDLCRKYFQALRREIVLYRDKGFSFTAAYIGGGTPTILPDELEETILFAKHCFPIKEVSVETNPNHLDNARLERLKKAGVNRLSVGVQTFNTDLLVSTGRYEVYGSGGRIAARLRDIAGLFDTLNADMIFNFPGQDDAVLDEDIETIMQTGIDQITYYPLMISDSTRELMRKTLGSHDLGREEIQYKRIIARLTPEYGFSSVWCFSRRPAMIDEYIVGYGNYAGLGSGSFGYIDGICYANTFDLDEYISRVHKGEIPVMAARRFEAGERLYYDLLMNLFGNRVDPECLKSKHRDSRFKIDLMLAAFRLIGGLGNGGRQLELTNRGRYYTVIMMREFFTAVNNFRDFCRR